jgi:hypothetical protein
VRRRKAGAPRYGAQPRRDIDERQRLLMLRGNGWHAPFGASPPSFFAHDLVRKPDTTFRDHAFAGGDLFLRWRRGGGQSSGAEACRENDFVCPRGGVLPLPAARGEVERSEAPRVRGPLRDSERRGWRNGVADLRREAYPSREAPHPDPLPARGERENSRERLDVAGGRIFATADLETSIDA